MESAGTVSGEKSLFSTVGQTHCPRKYLSVISSSLYSERKRRICSLSAAK